MMLIYSLSPISSTANTTAINKMSFAGDRVL